MLAQSSAKPVLSKVTRDSLRPRSDVAEGRGLRLACAALLSETRIAVPKEISRIAFAPRRTVRDNDASQLAFEARKGKRSRLAFSGVSLARIKLKRPRPLLSERAFFALTCALATGFLLCAALIKGVPALRHDWFWPVRFDAFLNLLIDWSSGWDVNGLGRAQPLLTQYLLIVPVALVGALAGSAFALGAYVALIGFVIGRAAFGISRRFGLGRISAAGLTAFLTLNPWVYSQLVAGHLAMLLSYASVAILWTELLEEEPDVRAAALAMFGAAFQPQFFLLACGACLSRIRTRAARLNLAYGSIAFLPSLIGIATHLADVSAVPLVLTWEKVQSVPILEAALLRGYFTGYAAAFNGWPGTIGVALFAAPSLLAPVVYRSRKTFVTCGLVLVLLICAAGLKGPLASVFGEAFEKLPAFGLYRELYDLVGLVAIGYALNLAAVLRRRPSLGWAPIVGAALLISVWVTSPPSAWWISSESIPAAPSIPVPGRVALLPPYQPLSYVGIGSGLDPAFAYRDLAVTPINAYFVEFPVTAAIARYWNSGVTDELAQLGTVAIVCRKGFAESGGAIALYGNRAGAPGAGRCSSPVVWLRHPAPILALQGKGQVCSLCSNVGAGNRFFGDVDPGSYVRLATPRGDTDPANTWTDARLALADDPEVGQPFGGVFTTSKKLLALEPSKFALANVEGKLVTETGATLAEDTSGYRWIALPRKQTSVRCYGRCALALEGDPGDALLNPPTVAAAALAWRPATPWLAFASLPAGPEQTIRYVTAYDRWWLAMVPGHVLRHVRLDAAINGWIVPSRGKRVRLLLIHAASVAQLCSEILGVAVFLRLVLTGKKRRIALGGGREPRGRQDLAN
jgi:hypothetical protein